MGLDGSGVNDPVPLMSSLLIAAGSTPSQTEPWVQPLSNVLDPFLNFMSFAMLSRVVLSWYPEIIASNTNNNTSNSNSSKDSSQPTETDDITSVMLATESDSSKRPPTTEKASLPIWITLIVIPTQPLLQAVKDVVPPAFGVDITPVFWLAIFTFIHEILLGQQGLLTMKIKYGI
jgi:YggT family protein